MQFEHLVVVNDPQQPFLQALTRQQLWAGLQWRINDPQPFVIGLEGCTILSREPGRIERQLDFGSFTLFDTVHYVAEEWVRFETAAHGERAGGALHISIEVPAPDTLALRFVYATTLEDAPGSESAEIAEFIRSAYRQADIDTVHLIRQHMTGAATQ